MKNLLITLMFLPVLLWGQTNLNPTSLGVRGAITIAPGSSASTFVDGGGRTAEWTTLVLFNSQSVDETTGFPYQETDIQAGHVIWDGACNRYTILDVNTAGPGVTLELDDLNGAGAPTGAGSLLDETGRFTGFIVGVQQSVVDCMESHYGILSTSSTLNNNADGTYTFSDGTTSTLIDTRANSNTLSPTLDVNNDGVVENTVQDALEAIQLYGSFVDQDAAALGGVPTGGWFYVPFGSTVYSAGSIVRKD